MTPPPTQSRPASQELVLASSSPWRRRQLEQLGLPYRVIAPEVDETPGLQERAVELVGRLALAKARKVAATCPVALVIGGDQVAEVGGRIIGKPGTRERAEEQLRGMSGRELMLYSGLVLVDAASGRVQSHVERCRVRFRVLDEDAIGRYLEREQALDCTGAVRIEGLGIALLQSLASDDPSAIIGLPLIALVTMLANEGVRTP